MKLTTNNGTEFYIDEEDYELIKDFNLRVQIQKFKMYERKYIQFQYNGKTVCLHRFLMGFPKGLHVDHVDNDSLNNRRKNLRLCTHSQNMANSKSCNASSKFKGVSYEKSINKWRSQIKKDGIVYNLGRYDNQEEAARVYDVNAIELHGKFARTNKMMGLLKYNCSKSPNK